MNFDLLIKGGEVVDPAAGLSGVLDVGIVGDRIAAVERELPTEGAGLVIDASGQYVTPGLIDLHTHAYWGVSYWGIEADPVAARTGVTTWLDVGSSGAYSFPGFRRYVAEANQARVLALLNISYVGLIGPTFELANLDYCNVPLAVRTVEANRDIAVGIKARIDANTTRGTGLEPLRRAREAADQLELPLMVHIGLAPPFLAEIFSLLRPGDILTHCFTGAPNRIVDQDGKIYDYVKRLWDQGLILDIGHGTGSFSYETTEAVLAAGLLPDVISSDIHQMSVQGPMYDLPTVMSKFLNLGLSLSQVVERTTTRPAKVIRRPDLGTLQPGAVADVAVFGLENGDYTFYDVSMNPRKGTQRLVNKATIIGGKVMPRRPERPVEEWAKLDLPAAQRVLIQK